jgi:hypothetical protein
LMAVTVAANNIGEGRLSTEESAGVTFTHLAQSAGDANALLLLLQLDPEGAAPTGVTAVWDSGAANQTMTLIEQWVSGGISFYMFGLIAPTTGTGISAVISWTNACYSIGAFSAWQGVNQASVAAAFTNPTHVSVVAGSTTQGFAITSAVSNMVAGHFNTDRAWIISVNNILLYDVTAWSGAKGAELWDATASYDSGAASVTLSVNMVSFDNTVRMQGVNINAEAGQPAVKRVGGVKFASRMSARSGAMWRKAGELLVPDKAKLSWM